MWLSVSDWSTGDSVTSHESESLCPPPAGRLPRPRAMTDVGRIDVTTPTAGEEDGSHESRVTAQAKFSSHLRIRVCKRWAEQ